jgi:hypothetical protein
MTTIDTYKVYLPSALDGEFPIQFLSTDELNQLKNTYELKNSEYSVDLIPNDGFYQIYDANTINPDIIEELATDLIASYLDEDNTKQKIILLAKIHDIIVDKYYLNELKKELEKYINEHPTDNNALKYLDIVNNQLIKKNKSTESNIQLANPEDKILLFYQGNKASRLSSIRDYVLQNRKSFPLFIRQYFQNEVRKLPFSAPRVWNPTLNQFVEKLPFEQQKFVSYYLSEYTPYRGLLLYHGLGSGKTGSSIMIAEGFRNRRVVVLLPASLHSNYENEIRTFGEIAYKTQFNWKFQQIPIDIQTGRPYNYIYEEFNNKGITSDLLNSIIIKYNDSYGIFMINYTADKPNYDELSLTDKNKIDTQIKKMLEWKYTILHYNAGPYAISNILQKCLLPEQYKKMLKDLFNTETKTTFSQGTLSRMIDYIFNPNNNVPNPFDDKVVIIDEVHNITSHLSGSGYVAIFIYELLMRAKNCKLVFLSGTPVINSSFELGLLFNMLNGFIYEYSMHISKTTGILTSDELTTILKSSKYIDRFYIDTTNKIIKFTLVPREFENSFAGDKYIGIKKSVKDIKYEDMIDNIILTLRNNGYEVNNTLIKETIYSLFPDILNHATAISLANTKAKPVKTTTKSDLNYLMGSNKRLRMLNDELFREKYTKEPTLFKNKIQGYVSFYNEIAGIDEQTGYDLFPAKINASPAETDVIMSDYQFIEYCSRAKIEQTKEEQAKLQRLILRERAIKGDIIDFGEIPTTFRVYTRQAGIFVFPPNIERPTRTLVKNIKQLSYDKVYKDVTTLIKINNIEERYHKLNNMLLRYKLLSESKESNNDLTLFSVLRDIYPNHIKPGNKLELFKLTIQNDIPTIKTTIITDNTDIDEAVKDETSDDILQDDIDEKGNVVIGDNCDDEYGACSNEIKEEDVSYERAIINAMNKLTPNNLKPASSLTDNGASVNYLTLDMLSPKYSKILDNINKTPGLVMCYSQYRSVEGIELLSRVLKYNGYTPYTSQPESLKIDLGMRVRYEYETDKWRTGIIIQKGKHPTTGQMIYRLDNQANPKGYYKRSQIHPCQYALWTGTETVDQRKETLSVFNSDDNKFGQRCLVIMITQAGAEGISLFNVRQVHILESYWNNIRIRQVVGRARRIRSHISLPKDQQNVKIFNYIIKFAPHHKYDTEPTPWLKNLIDTVGFDTLQPLFNRLYNINELSDATLTFINEESRSAIKYDNNNTADEILNTASLIKDEINDYFTKLMKESSVDCDYNKADNVLSDPSLASLNCYQNITDIQNNPFIYNYSDDILTKSAISTVTQQSIKPTTQQIDIDFPYNNPIDKTKKINLAIKTEIMSDQPIPSSFADKLSFIKSGMDVYLFDITTRSIKDNLSIGKIIEVTKPDGTKGTGVKFTDIYKKSLK